MTSYELDNTERKYFGLKAVSKSWDRKSLSPTVSVYFDGTKILKIISWDKGYSYLEYDTNINTINREIILPKTNKGKEQKLTVAKLIKIKGSGIQFTASFQGGGIHVYDHRRSSCIIKSYIEEGQISNYNDVGNWVKNYITSSPANYFEWLCNQLSRKKEKHKAKAGDIIAFQVGRNEYGFARVILSNYVTEHLLLNDEVYKSNLFIRPLLISIYATTSSSLEIDFDELIKMPTLNPIEIFDSNVYNGEFPIVAFRQLKEDYSNKIELFKLSKYLTIPLTKTDILNKNNKW